MTHKNTASRRFIILAAITLLVAAAGISMTLAQQLIQPDGRLNQIAHFGGDALYCVDANNQTTNNLPAMAEGGFRLLNGNGQEVWFVPGADVDTALAAAKESGESQLAASGQGSYGAAYLYAYYVGDSATFVFTGYDEHGKPNSLTFTGCTPAGPERQPDAADEALCAVEYRFDWEVITLLQDSGDDTSSEVIACGLCESEGGVLEGGTCYLAPELNGIN